MPAASVGQQKVPSFSPQQHPTTHCTTNTSKVEWIELQSFASATLFSWILTSRLPLPQASWQLFAGKNGSTTSKKQKSFPRVHWILKHRFLCYRNKQNFYFLLAKCVDSVLINKDVFQPSYNDLKFMVWTTITCIPT